MDTNIVILKGRLTKTPNVKGLGSTKVIEISLAVNESYKKDDQWQEMSNFFDVEYYTKNSTNIEEKLKKGTTILIQGKLRQDGWETEDGNKRSKVKIIANKIEVLGWKR